MLNIMLVDNCGLVRCGLRYLLQDVRGLKVIGESACDQAIFIAEKVKPDIAIVSLNKFGISQLEEIERLLRRLRTLKVLVLTDYMNEVVLSCLLKGGAHGCLSMNTSKEEIIQALNAIKKNERFVSGEIASFLASSELTIEKASPFKRLSGRELQVVLMTMSGSSPRRIAEKLFLSAKTISTYRNNIFNKLEVKNEVQMILLAIKHGLEIN